MEGKIKTYDDVILGLQSGQDQTNDLMELPLQIYKPSKKPYR